MSHTAHKGYTEETRFGPKQLWILRTFIPTVMSMTDARIIQMAIEEVENKGLIVIQLFLEVHKLVYEDNLPKVLRVDRDKEKGTVIVYFAVKDEGFSLALYFATEPDLMVQKAEIVPGHFVYFQATSENLSLETLCTLTTLKPAFCWRKGELPHKSDYNGFQVVLDERPDDFEDLLDKLLSLLEQDREGILQLAATANGCINVSSIYYNANNKYILGALQISKSQVKRLAALDLTIDFSISVDGIPFNEDNPLMELY